MTMTVYQNIFGKRYESDEPCFMTIADGTKVWSRLRNDWLDWASLVEKATAESHTWQPREVGIPSIKWQLGNTYLNGWDFAPGLDDTEALASEQIVNGEVWTGAAGATPPNSWIDDVTDLAFSLGGASDILIMESPVLGGAITQAMSVTPNVVYVVELSVYDSTTGDAKVGLSYDAGVTFIDLPIGPVVDPSGSAAALKSFSFWGPPSGNVAIRFSVAGAGRLMLRYARMFLETELTGSGTAAGGDIDPPNPIKGPYMAFGTEFWIKTDSCKIGFDLDTDPEPDIWMSGQEVCDSDIEDRIKMAINAQLIADGCPKLPCMTIAGNFTVAHIKSQHVQQDMESTSDQISQPEDIPGASDK